MTRIFLCYRSGDDAYAAALIDDRLSRVFGAAGVFRASRSIRPGESYSEVILRELEQCETMLVVVGPTWVERLHPGGCGSAGDVDWVRTEIATALNNGTRVIPILLSRTPRLVERQLPVDIAALAHRQYVKFEHRTVERDFAQLVAALDSTDWLSTVDASPIDRGPSAGKGGEFDVNCEVGADGNVELDIVSRDGQGAIVGRLSGRASRADLPRLAAIVARSASQVASTMDSKDCSATDLAGALRSGGQDRVPDPARAGR